MVFAEGLDIDQGQTNDDLGSGNGDFCPSLMPTGAIANSGHEMGVFDEVRKWFKNSVGFANLRIQ
jgi:hypothetical protein